MGRGHVSSGSPPFCPGPRDPGPRDQSTGTPRRASTRRRKSLNSPPPTSNWRSRPRMADATVMNGESRLSWAARLGPRTVRRWPAVPDRLRRAPKRPPGAPRPQAPCGLTVERHPLSLQTGQRSPSPCPAWQAASARTTAAGRRPRPSTRAGGPTTGSEQLRLPKDRRSEETP